MPAEPGHYTDHRDLLVWQKAVDLCVSVYQLTDTVARAETFSLTDQLRRAAVSVSSNIGEGAAKGSSRQYLRSLYVARGSLAELETQLVIALRVGYLSSDQFPHGELVEVRKLLCSLISAITRKQPKRR